MKSLRGRRLRRYTFLRMAKSLERFLRLALGIMFRNLAWYLKVSKMMMLLLITSSRTIGIGSYVSTSCVGIAGMETNASTGIQRAWLRAKTTDTEDSRHLKEANKKTMKVMKTA